MSLIRAKGVIEEEESSDVEEPEDLSRIITDKQAFFMLKNKTIAMLFTKMKVICYLPL